MVTKYTGSPQIDRRHRRLLATLCVLFAFYPLGARQPAAARQAEAAVMRSNSASMQSFQIPSHGSLINAFVYVAAGAGPHPAVVLLHGFPGNERNLDLAQDMRRAGWDVLYFDYRGSWGSPGDFSFSHGIEDTAAAIDYVRSRAMANILRLDPSRIVVIGHSMGGFMAVQAAAADPGILGMGLISAADLGGRIPQPLPREREQAAIQGLSAGYEREGTAPLSGCTPEGLAHETLANAAQWSFMAKVGALKNRPALIVTSDDAYARGDQAFAAALRRAGNSRVATLHLSTDHAYSDQRGVLSGAVLRWLATVSSTEGTR
jgi:pimeloyl-ACP methyl ester carboxylesterase